MSLVPPPNCPATALVRRVVALVAVVLFIGPALVGSQVVSAHSGLAAASPGPGATVGGTIDEIQLFYGDVITAIDGSVTAPDGEVLDTTFVLTSNIEVTIVLGSRLVVPGEYAVRHNVISIDGDRVEAAYLFTYDPAAPAPQLIFSDDEPGRPWIIWLVAAGGVAVLVFAVRLVVSIRRRNEVRAAASPPSAGSEHAGGG